MLLAQASSDQNQERCPRRSVQVLAWKTCDSGPTVRVEEMSHTEAAQVLAWEPYDSGPTLRVEAMSHIEVDLLEWGRG